MRTVKRALSVNAVCELYDLEPGTLANLRSAKKGARYHKVGRKIFYRPEDVEAWLFQNPVQTVDSVEQGGRCD